VVVRPYRARQEGSATAYEGHEGIRDWVASLDDETRISLELKRIEITGSESALVEADVWFDRSGERSGGPTVSTWHFTMGKLDEAVGYATREDALSAART
jgi:hypothetical protein